MKNLLKSMIYLTVLTSIMLSCSNDDESVTPEDNRSFTTDTTTDYFINRDGTINILVTGEFTDNGVAGNTIERGFVYGTSTSPTVEANNFAVAIGGNPVNATFYNLATNQNIFIRGYFEMEDGSYFYGNEIQVSTDIDASNSRSIAMNIKPDLFFQNSEGITPELDVTAIEKESPVEIGFEYSLNQDFSNSSVTLDSDIEGNVFVTTYSEYVTDLMPNTVYHFRPYAKYADGTVTNGGSSTATFATD